MTTNQSLLCVGLDPSLEKIPASFLSEKDPLFAFNRMVIDATHDCVCAYKPNAAFYEQYGLAGWESLQKTIDYIPDSIPVILDVKRGDIGNTATAYARAAFEDLGADAVTLNPYMGLDTMDPFRAYPDKGIFVLALTSNPGAADFQQLPIDGPQGRHPLYWHVIDRLCQAWGETPLGLVAGATQADLTAIRDQAPGAWLLIPGVGTQGGDLTDVLTATVRDPHDPRILINASRAILYPKDASKPTEKAVRAEAKRMQEEIQGKLKRP